MIALLTAAVLAATPAGAPAQLAAGLAAYTAGDFAAARQCFTALADESSAIAETMLGSMAARGQGGRPDPAAAAAYWFRAAHRGYPPAQLALARALIRGTGVVADPAAAWRRLRLAIERGDRRVAAAARAEARALAPVVPPPADDFVDWRPWPSGSD